MAGIQEKNRPLISRKKIHNPACLWYNTSVCKSGDGTGYTAFRPADDASSAAASGFQTAKGVVDMKFRHGALVSGTLLLLLLLSGCLFKSGEELYSLPKAPEDYLNLQEQIDGIIAGGAEYAAPLTGSNTKTVQLVDLDGDGSDEAIAFFRDTSAEKPLKIYIFRQNDKDYEVAAIIEGDGTAINSLTYADITGDGVQELLVGWQLSNKVLNCTVYSVLNFTPTLMLQAGYTKAACADLDGDGVTELTLCYLDPAGLTSQAEYYKFNGKDLYLASSAPLSFGMTAITSARMYALASGEEALYVIGSLTDGSIITDILTLKNDVLQNITLSPVDGMSVEVVRYYTVSGSDLNSDGILELPQPVMLPGSLSSSERYWIINWRQYSANGTATRVFSTYHNYTDNHVGEWYLLLPEEWLGRMTLTQRETIAGEHAYVFSTWSGTEQDSQRFLSIYKLTGVNREERSKLGNRFVLLRTSDTIYAAEFAESASETYRITNEDLIGRFHLMLGDWSTE